MPEEQSTQPGQGHELIALKKSLAKKEFMFQALQMMNQELVSITSVEKAIGVAATYLWEMVPYTVVYYVVYDPKESVFKSIAHVKEQVSEEYLVGLYKKIATELQEFDPNGVGRSIKIEETPHIDVLGIGTDERVSKKPGKGLTLPLKVGEKYVGGFHISLPGEKAIDQEDENFVRVMLTAVLASLERINILQKAQESKLETLIRSLTNGVIMFNEKKQVVLANPRASEMTGLPTEGYNLNEFFKLFPEVNLDEFVEKALWETTKEAAHVPEVRLAHFFYELFCTPLKDADDKVVGGAVVLNDITHLKEIDKMKTEFVSIASHQLRTPLTSINWHVEMLMDGDLGELQGKQRESMQEVYNGSRRMVRLVNDLLNVSRLETGRLKIEPESVELVSFVEEILKEAGPIAKAKNCSLNFKKPAESIPDVSIDRTLVWQVIHNLITNAIRYSSKEGASSIDILIDTADKEYYTVSVQDYGMGIPQDVQKRIFERFFRADNAKQAEAEGSGLGLYIAKLIMEASKGKLWFESEEGKGTTFFVSIPKSGMPSKEGERSLAS